MQSRPPAEATWAELPRENAQVQDIALYKRERAVHQGSLIAVNANYTCYAIRGARVPATAQAGLPRPHNHALARLTGGMVRVIHRATEEKALLRGHALEVVDLKFLPGQDVIATVANDGNVYVWRLTCVGTEIKCVPLGTADQPHPPWLPDRHPSTTAHLGCCHRRSEPVLQATWGERPPQGGVDRVVFQPTPEPELLASVMGGHSLLLWSLQSAPCKSSSAARPRPRRSPVVAPAGLPRKAPLDPTHPGVPPQPSGGVRVAPRTRLGRRERQRR